MVCNWTTWKNQKYTNVNVTRWISTKENQIAIGWGQGPSSYRTVSIHRQNLSSTLCCPNLVCNFRDRHILAKKASILTQVLTEGAVIPPVVDVQVQLLRRCQSSTVTKPPDWRTVIWTRDTGDDSRGQAKLAHQRGESTLQAISCSSLQWIGSPIRPPTRPRAGRPRLTNGANRRTRWSAGVLGVSIDKEFKGRRDFCPSWLHRVAGLENSVQTTSLSSWTINNVRFTRISTVD